MIRFIGEGRDGPVLFLGLSEGNLEQLRADAPIAFELGDLGVLGFFALACGDAIGVEALRAEAGELPIALLTLVEADMAQLRGGRILTRDLRELGLPVDGNVVLFRGETELAMLADLRASGLIDEDVTIEGLEEYLAHEAGLVPGCPDCDAGRPHHMTTSAISGSVVAERPPRKWRDEAMDHPYLVILAVILICVAVGLIIELSNEPGSSETPRSEPTAEARAQLESDKARRRLLFERRPSTLAPTLTAAPCPIAVEAPEPPGSLPLVKPGASGSPQQGFERAARAFLMTQTEPSLDIVPARAEGTGPVTGRLHADETQDLRLHAFEGGYHLTLIVHAFIDPELPLAVREATTAYQQGSVRGSLLVWSYPERRFVCASPPVDALTGKLTIGRFPGSEPGSQPALEDALAKARVQTLAMAAQVAVRSLRQIGP